MIIYSNSRERKNIRIDDTVRNDNEPIFVREVGHSIPQSGINQSLSARDVWTMHFVTSGSCRFSGVELKAGDGYLIPVNTPFTINVGEGFEHYWIMFGGNMAPDLLADAGLEPSPHLFGCGFFGQIRRDFDLTVSAPISGEYDLPLLMISLFWKLLAAMKACRSAAPDRQNEYIRLASDFIDANYSRRVSVEDIAAAAHITSRYMYKLFVKHFGKAPLEVLTERRMECARYLLSTTGLSIDEIAKDVGYSNPNRFALVFREHHGMPPGRWRYIHTEHTDF